MQQPAATNVKAVAFVFCAKKWKFF